MKIWGFCDANIRPDVGWNFIACFWDYYIFPSLVLVIIITIIAIILFGKKRNQKNPCIVQKDEPDLQVNNEDSCTKDLDCATKPKPIVFSQEAYEAYPHHLHLEPSEKHSEPSEKHSNASRLKKNRKSKGLYLPHLENPVFPKVFSQEPYEEKEQEE